MSTSDRRWHVGEILRKMFNLAIRWRIRTDNPAAGFARNAEAPRDRYLSTDEIGRLSAALDAHPNRGAADAVRLILLTGARRGEVPVTCPRDFGRFLVGIVQLWSLDREMENSMKPSKLSEAQISALWR